MAAGITDTGIWGNSGGLRCLGYGSAETSGEEEWDAGRRACAWGEGSAEILTRLEPTLNAACGVGSSGAETPQGRALAGALDGPVTRPPALDGYMYVHVGSTWRGRGFCPVQSGLARTTCMHYEYVPPARFPGLVLLFWGRHRPGQNIEGAA